MLVEELGMTPELLRQGIESPLFQWRDRTTDRIVAEFDYRDISDVLTYPYALQLEQHKTIEIARDIALGIDGFELYRERELTDLIQNDDGVEITVQAPDGLGNPSRSVLDRCHGGRSVVQIARHRFPRIYLAGTLHHRVHLLRF